jgi:hypothetical protein
VIVNDEDPVAHRRAYINIGDDAGRATGFNDSVSITPRRILVAVVPPLLSDLLSRLVSRVEFHVVEMPLGGTPPDGRFDAAFVNTDVELASMKIDTLVRLPMTQNGLGTARITNGEGEEWVELTSVDDLIGLIDWLSADLGSV